MPIHDAPPLDVPETERAHGCTLLLWWFLFLALDVVGWLIIIGLIFGLGGALLSLLH